MYRHKNIKSWCSSCRNPAKTQGGLWNFNENIPQGWFKRSFSMFGRICGWYLSSIGLQMPWYILSNDYFCVWRIGRHSTNWLMGNCLSSDVYTVFFQTQKKTFLFARQISSLHYDSTKWIFNSLFSYLCYSVRNSSFHAYSISTSISLSLYPFVALSLAVHASSVSPACGLKMGQCCIVSKFYIHITL